MFNIVPKKAIEPILINEVSNEAYSIFQNRNVLHDRINGFHVYINQYAWDAFLNHSMNVYKQTKHEAQGIFLGKHFKDSYGEFAIATEYSEGVGESSHAYVGMSEECVAEISKKCLNEKLLMLIWIHTHPNFGVFYSGTDLNCLKTNFHMPFQSGIVVDIIRHESKGFKVEGSNVNEFDNYFIYNVEKKQLFKPYQIKLEAKQVEVKKNENQNLAGVSGIQHIKEFELIKKELYEIKGHILKTQNSNKEPFEFQSKQYLNELLFLKKELAEIKDYLANLNMQGKELPFIYHFRKQKEYLDVEFRNINMSIEKKTDTPDLLNSFKKGNVIIKRNIFFFLVIAVASILIVCILVLFYLLKNYKS